MRIHKDVEPYTKEEAEVAFAQGTSEQIRDALLGVTFYEEDWRWVQTACLAALDSSDPLVQEIAILCLGHLATFHKTLDLTVVLPALQARASHPELASALHRALGDIAFQVEDKSYFVENWDELPQRIKEVLVEEGVFDKRGKRVCRLFRRPIKYKPPTRQEAEVIFAQGTSDQIRDALTDVTFYEKDWRWVQTICLAFLDTSDTSVQLTAIDCLGKLARFHRKLDLAIVLSALQAHASDPALARKITEAFITIAIAVERAPGLVKNWGELPQRMKDRLIKNGVFDSRGKISKKGGFIGRFFGR